MNRVVSTERRAVLIVDDDEDLVVALRETLEAEGYRVRSARDGQEALRELAAWIPSIVLLDVHMPKMDGETLFDIMKSHRLYALIPVLFITGTTIAGPWVSYETKPLDPASLISAVKKYAP